MPLLRANTPTPNPGDCQPAEKRHLFKKVQLKLDTLHRPPSPNPAEEPEAVQLTGPTSPPTWVRSPTVADDALAVQCWKKPARTRCKALRLAVTLKRTRSPVENRQFAPRDYADGSYTLMFACLALCHMSLVFPPGGGRVWVCSPRGVRILSRAARYCSRGGGGGLGVCPVYAGESNMLWVHGPAVEPPGGPLILVRSTRPHGLCSPFRPAVTWCHLPRIGPNHLP